MPDYSTTTLALHRCRFVDFTPSAITALAFPPLPLPSLKGKNAVSHRHFLKFGTLAVGRANGNIEICEWTGVDREFQSAQAWVVRKTLSGPYLSKVDSIAFTIRYPEKVQPHEVPSCSDLRLFSSGGGSELIEWDLERCCVRRTISSQGGSIWSIAANPSSSLLALGCEDGSVRLLSLVHDTLNHHRRFDKVKGRLLSIAWGPPVPRQVSWGRETHESDSSSDDDNDDEDWSDSWLVTGGSDSSLRKWDVSTGRLLDRMATDKTRGDRTLVWAVSTLGDGTIVSGDSLGMVKFWDSRTCTQLQSFQGHDADVLCLTVGPEGTTVYSSGVDQKITQFSFVRSSHPGSSSTYNSYSRWVQSSSRRLHSHDVRALVTWPPYNALPNSHKRQFPADIAPVLASGGLDVSVVMTPAALPTSTIKNVINPLLTSAVSSFEDSYHRRLAYSTAPSSTSALQVARQARLLLCMGDTALNIWRILSKPSGSDEDYLSEAKATPKANWEKVLEMELKVHTNLVASAISDDGRWLVVSDMYETKLFNVIHEGSGDLKPKRIRDFAATLKRRLPNSIPSTGGSAFCFTPDSSKLVMSTTLAPYVLVIDLRGPNGPDVLRRFDHHRTHNALPGQRSLKKIDPTKLKREGMRSREQEGGGDIDMATPEAFGDHIINDETNDGTLEDPQKGGDNEAAGHRASNDVFPDMPVTENISEPSSATISRMTISSDGQWLATTDSLSRTHIFNLDSIQHHCSLPSFPQPVHALAFNSKHSGMLVLGFPNNTFQIFDVESRHFPEWSKDLCRSPWKRLSLAHDPILGVTFDPPPQNRQWRSNESRHALFWGSTWICQVKLDVPTATNKKRHRSLHETTDDVSPLGTITDRDEMHSESQSRNYKMITHYRPILLVDFIGPGELVVVERPLVDILATLPPAYFKPKYGNS